MILNDLNLKYLEYSSRQSNEISKGLVILLHGRCANEDDLFDLAPKLNKNCIILSPRAPIVMGEKLFGWFHTQYLADRTPIHDPAEAEEAKQSLILFIKNTQRKYRLEYNYPIL